jgi:hypothetical protein
MFRFLRFLVSLSLLVGFIWFGMTVPLGQHTLFGHVSRIWKSDETQDLVKGTKEAARPAAQKIKKAVDAMRDDGQVATKKPDHGTDPKPAERITEKPE